VRNPLIVILVLAALILYSFVRESARLAMCGILGLEFTVSARARGLLGIAALIKHHGSANRDIAIAIASGPLGALIAGYLALLLLRKRGEALPAPARVFLCIFCYLALILDPIYYAVIPLARLGGEPSALASSSGLAMQAIQFVALGLLVINTLLIRKYVMPILKSA